MALGELERYREVALSTSAGDLVFTTSVAGTKGKWAPMFQPIVLKQWSVQHYTTFAYTATVAVGLFANSSPGLTATGNYTLIDTITLTTGAGSDTGQIFFSSPNPALLSLVYIQPGTELVAHILAAGSTSTVSESHAVKATLFYEPWEENPNNNSNMTAA